MSLKAYAIQLGLQWLQGESPCWHQRARERESSDGAACPLQVLFTEYGGIINGPRSLSLPMNPSTSFCQGPSPRSLVAPRRSLLPRLDRCSRGGAQAVLRSAVPSPALPAFSSAAIDQSPWGPQGSGLILRPPALQSKRETPPGPYTVTSSSRMNSSASRASSACAISENGLVWWMSSSGPLCGSHPLSVRKSTKDPGRRRPSRSPPA